jgi:hypothetical protein
VQVHVPQLGQVVVGGTAEQQYRGGCCGISGDRNSPAVAL